MILKESSDIIATDAARIAMYVEHFANHVDADRQITIRVDKDCVFCQIGEEASG